MTRYTPRRDKRPSFVANTLPWALLTPFAFAVLTVVPSVLVSPEDDGQRNTWLMLSMFVGLPVGFAIGAAIWFARTAAWGGKKWVDSRKVALEGQEHAHASPSAPPRPAASQPSSPSVPSDPAVLSGGYLVTDDDHSDGREEYPLATPSDGGEEYPLATPSDGPSHDSGSPWGGDTGSSGHGGGSWDGGSSSFGGSDSSSSPSSDGGGRF